MPFMPASVPESPVEFMPVALPLRFDRVPDIALPDESVLPEPIDDEPVLPLLVEPVEPDVPLPELVEPEPVVPLPIELEPLALPVPPAELGVLVVLPVPVAPVLPELIDPVDPAVPEPVVALPEPVVPLLPIELAEPLLPVPELLIPEPVEPVALAPPGVVADPVDEPVVPVLLVPLVPVDPVDPVCATVTPAPNASAMPAARAARECLEALFMMILQVDVTVRSKCPRHHAIRRCTWTQLRRFGNAHAAAHFGRAARCRIVTSAIAYARPGPARAVRDPNGSAAAPRRPSPHRARSWCADPSRAAG